MWQARTEALDYLTQKQPSQLAVVERTFELFDACVDAYETAPSIELYPRVCAVTLVKAKNLAHGAFSLILDGLGQEAGALMRPMIEYAELLTYFRIRPEMTERAVAGNLPKAGERAKAIGSIYKTFREHLNQEASHSSFSEHSISHVIDVSTLRLRKSQLMVPEVVDRNVRDLVVQLHLLLREAILSLEPAKSPEFNNLAERYERLKVRMFHVFNLDT